MEGLLADQADTQLEFFASCLAGAEKLLGEELRSLGAQRVRPLSGGVAFFGDAVCAMRACLWSRLASRVLLVVGRFGAADADELYAGAKDLHWESILASDAAFTVRANGTNDNLRNTRFTALKVKDAVADRLREERADASGFEAKGMTGGVRTPIDVRLRGNKATVSLDFSGEALNRRNYLNADDGDQAALECSLAAIALAEAGWAQCAAQGDAFIDPACGTGILLAEAASIACDQAPQLHRSKWGFQGWAGFDPAAFDALVDEADVRFSEGLARMTGAAAESASTTAPPDSARVRMAGTSTSSPSISAARDRIRRAGMRQAVTVEAADAECIGDLVKRIMRAAQRSSRMAGTGGDVRMVVASDMLRGNREARARVRADEETFVACSKSVPTGSRFAVLDPVSLEGLFGVKPASRMRLGAGRVECELLVFDEPPAGYHTITIADLSGGAPRSLMVLEQTSDQFAARLRKVFKERRKWAQREGVSCYRIYDADLNDFAVAIDMYTGAGDARGNTYLHISEYAPPASVDAQRAQRRFSDVLAIAPEVCGVRPDHVFCKTRVREKGGSQYGDIQRRPYVTTIEEGGHLFEVDLSGRLDTGIFLDHRMTRQLVADRADGKRFCNLFAYTGSVSVYAAAGGAVETVTVDMSQTYLDWARRNMAANGFSGAAHKFEKADAMRWITEARRSGRRFDLIFVDPPTFSNSKTMGKRTWDVQRDHAELLIGVSRLLAEDGVAIFSCNLRSFKPDIEKLQKYGVSIEDISLDTIPEDFSRTPKIHKCYIVKHA